MDNSIQLLCSMSPKVQSKHSNFRFKKGTTVLALKKHIRRSSIFDKSVRTEKHEDLNIVESSTTTESTESSNSIKVINETPIIISDSDLSGKSENNNRSDHSDDDKELPIYKIRTSLPKDKREAIQSWIENIDIENKYQETVNYTELSTIYGDIDNENFVPKEKGTAVNSTFAIGSCKKFNELFVSEKYNKSLEKNDAPICSNGSYRATVINDSTSDRSSLSNSLSFKLIIEETQESNKDCSENCENKITVRKQKHFMSEDTGLSEFNKDSFSSPMSKKSEAYNTPIRHQTDEASCEENNLESLLDSFYGNTWRKKQDLILPKTEPKDRKPKLTYITQSERKPKKTSLLYKNPYLDREAGKSQTLLQNLQKSRLKFYTDSPMTEKLKKLCDPESETSNEEEEFHGARTRLNFDDSTEKKNSKCNNEDEDKDCDNVSNKENFNISDLGLSLEERIKKKIFKVNDLPVPLINQNTKKSTKTTSKPKTPKSIVDNNKGFKTPSINKAENIAQKPKKTDKQIFNDNSSSDEEWDKEISKITYQTPKTGTHSFLASLSDSVPILQCDMSARIFRSNFKTFKGELLTKLFKLYNEQIFENAIPHDTIFEWNDRMRTTAGTCHCKKITRRTGAVERSARIVLASKIIDGPGRLRDTLIHELCHAATWIVNCVSDGHGQYWKAWAFKAMKTFPELPPIKRCHDYGINTKYTYKCTGCGYSIGRHSKSLDIERKRCGYCYGKFEVLINKVDKKGEIKTVPTPKREANGFALFVKENYGKYKDTVLKHGDVMKILGQKFQEMKVNK